MRIRGLECLRAVIQPWPSELSVATGGAPPQGQGVRWPQVCVKSPTLSPLLT